MNTLQRVGLVTVWYFVGCFTYGFVVSYREFTQPRPVINTPQYAPSPTIPPTLPPVTYYGGLEYDYAADQEAEAYSVQDVPSPYGPRYDY